jgi:RNA polymerase sigma factor (sigma-70 family)
MQDDDDLLARLNGTPEQKDEAICELRGILLRGLSKSLNNRYGQPFSAEDIVQDALMKILSSLDQFEGRCKFTTWAMTVATRIGISSLRRKYHQDVSLEAFDGQDNYRMEIVAKESVGSWESSERDDLVHRLQQLIDTELTDKQRMAMRAFLAGFSTDGIADRVGTNRNAVYKLIHDARVKLKDGFERAGITADDVRMALA